MKNKKKISETWESDFLEFIDSDVINPPVILTERIKAHISDDVGPVLWRIIAKLAGLQAVCAAVTLFFCPQFSIGFAQRDYLATLVQHSDGFGFMIVCGVVFLGGGAALAPLFLNKAELRISEKSLFAYFPAISILAVLLFYLLGADIYMATALPWFIGGSVGSLIAFSLVKYFRTRIRFL